MRKYVLKILVTVTILALLFSYIGVQETLDNIYKMDIGTAIFALILLTIQQFVAALRWHIILKWMGEIHDLGKITQFFMIGSIANYFLFTSIAGLTTRALLLSRSGTSLKLAVYSLAIEKLFTAGTLLICFAVGLVVLFKIGVDIPHNTFLLAIFLAMGVLVLIAIGYLVFARFQFERMNELMGIVRSAIDQPGPSSGIVIVSMFIFAVGFYSKAVIAYDLNIGISLIAFIAIQPGIAFMSAFPVSLGGWGVREVSMVFGLGLLGVEAADALAISLAYGVLCVLSAFIAAGVSSLITRRTEEGQTNA